MVAQHFGSFLATMLLGCLLMGSLSALAGYWLVNLLWRLQVSRSWRERREKRLQKLLAPPKAELA